MNSTDRSFVNKPHTFVPLPIILKRFSCESCSKIYASKRNLIHHAEKQHPSNLSSLLRTINPEKKYKFSCDKCGNNFNKVHHFRSHQRKSHGDTSTFRKLTKPVFCVLCKNSIERDLFIPHLQEQHDISVESELLEFLNTNEFLMWKEQLEASSNSRYAKARATKVYAKNNTNKSVFCCYRSGQFSSKGTGKRLRKGQETCKMGGYCPAALKVTEWTEGKCIVNFVKTHIGHEIGQISGSSLISLKKFSCELCSQEYVKKRSLQRHAEKKHPESLSWLLPAINTKKKYQYSCGECGRHFNKAHQFRYHQRIVHGITSQEQSFNDSWGHQDVPTNMNEAPKLLNFHQNVAEPQENPGLEPPDLSEIHENILDHIPDTSTQTSFSEPVFYVLCSNSVDKDSLIPPIQVQHDMVVDNNQLDHIGHEMDVDDKLQTSEMLPVKLKRFTCDLCSKEYASKRSILQHVEKKHPSNLSLLHTINPEKKYQYSCAECGNNFNKVHHFRAHQRTAHGNTSTYRKLTKPVFCMLCKNSVDRDKFPSHLQAQHGITVEKEELEFSTISEFFIWKEQMEAWTKSSYVKHRATKISPKNKSLKKMFHCHRSGQFSSKGKGKRLVKVHKSCKMGGHCPSTIKVTELINGKCLVNFLKTHVGHEMAIDKRPAAAVDKRPVTSKPLKTPSKKIHCDMCSKEFVKITNLQQHAENKHPLSLL